MQSVKRKPKKPSIGGVQSMEVKRWLIKNEARFRGSKIPMDRLSEIVEKELGYEVSQASLCRFVSELFGLTWRQFKSPGMDSPARAEVSRPSGDASPSPAPELTARMDRLEGKVDKVNRLLIHLLTELGSTTLDKDAK